MEQPWLILIGTAASIGFLHTLVGVDHTLPFILLARSNRWRLRRTLWITALCGLAHVGSSVLIGALGIGFGVALDRLRWIETLRAGLAAWLLVGLGLAYAVWGLYRAHRGREHSHAHAHEDGTVHAHHHHHQEEHVHAHIARGANAITVLGLMVVFVLGPCEALIPMLMPPAFDGRWGVVAAVVGVFGASTILAMLVLVAVGFHGMRWVGLRSAGLGRIDLHMHALSGMAIAASGAAILLLGV